MKALVLSYEVHLDINSHRFDSPHVPIIEQGHYVSQVGMDVEVFLR